MVVSKNAALTYFMPPIVFQSLFFHWLTAFAGKRLPNSYGFLRPVSYTHLTLPTAFNSNRITTTWMKDIVGRSYFARRWSACGMQLLAALSSASMSTLRTDSPAVTSIKCC